VAYTGWLQFAGTEIINTARVAAYSRGVAVACGDPDLPASLGDASYTTAAADPAPWYDPSRPESAQFHGLLGLEYLGTGTSTAQRQWTELLGPGGVPGTGRRSSLEIEVRALAVASTPAGMSYGTAWLASALRGSECGPACSGDTLCLYTAAPRRPLIGAVDDGCGVVGDGFPDPDWDPVTGDETAPGGNALVRQLFNSAVIEAPKVVSETRLAGGLVREVRWTLRAGVPYWYARPRMVMRGGNGAPPNPDVYQDVILNYDPWTWQQNCPQEATCLDDDPFCVQPPPPPERPPAPVDPCYPNNPANDRPGQSHIFHAARTIFSIPQGTGPDWMDTVPIIRVYAGALPVRRLIMRWYHNPTGAPCDGSLDPCFSCAEITIPWLPRSTLLTIDGRTQRAYADCPGSSTLTEPRMYGPAGGVFTWPVFSCSTALCCELIADATSIASDSWMDIQMSYREDAI
jgi:hypothetical protein